MATETLHMRIGENLGNILLDIAQGHILKGDIEKDIQPTQIVFVNLPIA